jgi:hypothetical protein
MSRFFLFVSCGRCLKTVWPFGAADLARSSLLVGVCKVPQYAEAPTAGNLRQTQRPVDLGHLA